MKKLVLVFMFLLLAIPMVFAQDTFESYSPESKEFTILMPGEVHFKELKKKDMTLKVYSSGDAKGAYVIESGAYIDSSADFEALNRGVIKGMKESAEENGGNMEVPSPQDCSGPGWSGKRYNCQMGNKTFSVLVALSNNKDSVYTLLTTTGNKELANKFLNSLTVDPELASKAKPLEESSAYKEGKQAGYVFGILLAISAIVGIIVFIVKIATRKPKNQTKDQ